MMILWVIINDHWQVGPNLLKFGQLVASWALHSSAANWYNLWIYKNQILLTYSERSIWKLPQFMCPVPGMFDKTKVDASGIWTVDVWLCIDCCKAIFEAGIVVVFVMDVLQLGCCCMMVLTAWLRSRWRCKRNWLPKERIQRGHS